MTVNDFALYMIAHDYWPPFITVNADDEDTTPGVPYPPDPPKCPDCNGKGVITLFTGVVDCERCDGSGY